MGVVYRAQHIHLGRTVALKLLNPELAASEEFRERFIREARAAAELEHPNIVPVYDAGEEDDLLYIAMACVEGSDLKTLLAEEGKLPLRRALRIAGQIGSALDAAHARGLVHRDVKPANILVGPDDHAYLSDFGIVKELSSNGTTRTGSFVGTIDYCAPEQIEGRAVDARADAYALACVLYECLVGAPPFQRASDVAVLNAHLHAPPPKLSRVAPELPAGLEPVIAKALSKSPLDRYASCGEFIAGARGAAYEPRVHRRRLALSLAALAAAALLGGAAAVLVDALAFDKTPKTQAVVVVQKEPPPKGPDPDVTLAARLLKSNDGRTLNDVAYALIGAHDYARAIPFAKKAARRAPVGSLTRGFATYNLGFALYKTGRCREGLFFLHRALVLEPPSYGPYILPKIRNAEACVQRQASAPEP
jgi:protein kinase-like protein